MIDNWARSKITSHLGKRCCVCGGCYNLDYKTFEMGPKFSNIPDECSIYIQQLKYATNFKYHKTFSIVKKPVYFLCKSNNGKRKYNGLKRKLQIFNPTFKFNVKMTKMIFVICQECQRKILLQYKLSPILGK